VDEKGIIFQNTQERPKIKLVKSCVFQQNTLQIISRQNYCFFSKKTVLFHHYDAYTSKIIPIKKALWKKTPYLSSLIHHKSAKSNFLAFAKTKF
jgi:hypothetical protein